MLISTLFNTYILLDDNTIVNRFTNKIEKDPMKHIALKTFKRVISRSNPDRYSYQISNGPIYRDLIIGGADDKYYNFLEKCKENMYKYFIDDELSGLLIEADFDVDNCKLFQNAARRDNYIEAVCPHCMDFFDKKNYQEIMECFTNMFIIDEIFGKDTKNRNTHVSPRTYLHLSKGNKPEDRNVFEKFPDLEIGVPNSGFITHCSNYMFDKLNFNLKIDNTVSMTQDRVVFYNGREKDEDCSLIHRFWQCKFCGNPNTLSDTIDSDGIIKCKSCNNDIHTISDSKIDCIDIYWECIIKLVNNNLESTKLTQLSNEEVYDCLSVIYEIKPSWQINWDREKNQPADDNVRIGYKNVCRFIIGLFFEDEKYIKEHEFLIDDIKVQDKVVKSIVGIISNIKNMNITYPSNGGLAHEMENLYYMSSANDFYYEIEGKGFLITFNDAHEEYWHLIQNKEKHHIGYELTVQIHKLFIKWMTDPDGLMRKNEDDVYEYIKEYNSILIFAKCSNNHDNKYDIIKKELNLEDNWWNRDFLHNPKLQQEQ